MSVELEESRGNVKKRLEFIEGEIDKVEKAIGKYIFVVVLTLLLLMLLLH